QCQRLLSPQMSDAAMRKLKAYALLMAGGTPEVLKGTATLPIVLLESLAGDLRLMTQSPPVPKGMPRSLGRHLKRYAVLRRKLATTGHYKKLMGYWHAFHLPFAVFMYIVVVIHIAAVHIFRVH